MTSMRRDSRGTTVFLGVRSCRDCGYADSAKDCEDRMAALEAENARLRERLLRQTCAIKSLACKRSRPLGRAATADDYPLCGEYCEAVREAVDG